MMDTNKKEQFILTNAQLNQCNQVVNQLGMTWLTRKTYINCLPANLDNNKLTKAAVVNYRKKVIKHWEDVKDGNGKLLVNLYNTTDYQPMAQFIANNNKAWMTDVEPLVTYFDVQKCCDAVNLDPSVFYYYCQQYKQHMDWLPNVAISVNKMFDTNYPNQLYAMLQQWVRAVK